MVGALFRPIDEAAVSRLASEARVRSVRVARDASPVRWREIMGPQAEDLRQAILRAITDAYAENCQRFHPEDLGDNNITFGVAVSQNLRFLLELALDGRPDLEILRPRNSFVVVVAGGYQVHFYKAPPGVFDVRQLRFDASATQQELVESNAEQLAWRFDDTDATGGDAEHLVIVHFGDPIEGFCRADVGAPLESPTDGLQWDWVECLSNPADEILQPWTNGVGDSDEEDEDFGLRLREGEDDQGMSASDSSG
jgi:hypothetical protein